MKRILRSLLTLGLTLLLAVVTPPAARAQTGAPGSADPSFSQVLNTEGSVIQVATQPDGKIVALGNFPPNINAPSFRRLNVDGTLDPSFATTGVSIPGRATAFALQADGKVFYGGTGASGVLTASLGRLKADGTQDATFQPPTFASVSRVGDVLDVAVQADGKLLVAGTFEDLNGTPRPGLARLNADGSVDTAFVPPSAGIVFSSAQAVAIQADGKILAAGSVFIGTTQAQGIVRLNADGTQDSTFTPQTVDQLTSFGSKPALAVQADGKILLGGAFSKVGNNSRGFLARLLPNGSVDGSFSPATDAPVLSIVIQGDGKILLGGRFVAVGSALRYGVARLNASGGVDTTFDPGTGDNGGNASVKSIAIAPNGKVIVAGGFAGFGTSTRDNLALLLNDYTGTGTGNNALTVPGTANLWLAGAAPGTTASTGQDTLANAAPLLVTGVPLTPGATLTFAATGTVAYFPGGPASGPDGLGTAAFPHDAENGIAAYAGPFNGLMGVFLNGDVPAGATPAGLDFGGSGTPAAGLNYVSLTPALRQPFFIGDGKTTAGAVQTITVPAGATRLFLGAFDQSDSENNPGSFAVTVTTGGTSTGGATLAITDASEKSTSDATGGTAIPGDTLTYNFTVRNPGATAATGISITTVLNGTKFKSLLTAGGEVLNPTVNSSQLVLSKFNLAPGASLSFVLKVKVPATFPTDGRIVGLGFASVTADGVAPLAGLAGLNSTVLPPYQTLVSYNSNVGPGDVLTFRFTTTNRSTIAASNVTSVVSVPAGVNFLSANADSGALINVAPDGGGNLRIVLPDLAPNSVVIYSVSVRIPYDAAGQRHHHPARHPARRRRHHLRRARRHADPQRQPRRQPAKLAISKSIVDPFSLAGLFLFDPARAAKLAAAFPQIAFYATNPATGQPVPNGPAIQAFGAALNPFVGQDDTGSATGGTIRSVTPPSTKQPVTYVTFTLLYENTGGSNASEFSVTDRVPVGFAYVPTAPASALPGDLLPAPYALINGVPATPDNLQVTDNGRTLNFRVKAKLKPGASGLIVYQLQVVPVAQGGVNPGNIVDTKGAASPPPASPATCSPARTVNRSSSPPRCTSPSRTSPPTTTAATSAAPPPSSSTTRTTAARRPPTSPSGSPRPPAPPSPAPTWSAAGAWTA